MKTQSGFSLIEMAIVLVIVTLLVGGLVAPLAAQLEARRILETERTLADARDAVVGFSRTRGGVRHLPCPDTDSPPDGEENRSVDGTCASPSGWLPWITLGVGDRDAWNHRLRYEVDPAFSNDEGINEATPLTGNIEICDASSCASPVPDIVYVLVSHGPNGLGATTLTGSQKPLPTSADELANLDADGNYVSHERRAGDTPYDDMLTWVSLSQFFPRACPAGCP